MFYFHLTGADRLEVNFQRNSGSRRSNRDSAIKSLIRASAGTVRQTVMRSSWGSSEDVNSEQNRPRSSPRHSAEPSPSSSRKMVKLYFICFTLTEIHIEEHITFSLA